MVKMITKSLFRSILETLIQNSKIEKTAFTPTRGANYAAFGNSYYEKNGRIVHFHIGVSGLTQAAGNTIYQLPEEINPHTPMGFVGMGSSTTSYAGIQISATGEVRIYPPSGSTHCQADLTWLI